MENCFVCQRIEAIKKGENPCFIRELETGYVVAGDFQRFYGYTLFICKQHATELHFLDNDYKIKFLNEMSLVAQAVYNAFKPEKLNYELIGMGNGGAHMHWHIFPINSGDLDGITGPVWRLDPKDRTGEKYRITPQQLTDIKEKINKELDLLVK